MIFANKKSTKIFQKKTNHCKNSFHFLEYTIPTSRVPVAQ